MDKEQAERLIKALERIADCMGKPKHETKLAAGATPFRSVAVIAGAEAVLSASAGSSDRVVNGGVRESGPA